MPDAPEIAELDEMLELLFWMEGEGLQSSANLTSIARFLVESEDRAAMTLAALALRGDVLEQAGSYSLTEVGRREAARRFVADFAPLLHQGHGECNDPDCECRTAGAAECAIHQR
jgi:hypothetical protein